MGLSSCRAAPWAAARGENAEKEVNKTLAKAQRSAVDFFIFLALAEAKGAEGRWGKGGKMCGKGGGLEGGVLFSCNYLAGFEVRATSRGFSPAERKRSSGKTIHP